MWRTSEKTATSASRGFTLVELLLVVTLMAVLTAVTLPRLSSVHERTRLDQGAQTLAAYLRTARLEAVHRGLSTQLVFAQHAQAYRLRVQDPSAHYETSFIETDDDLFDAWQFLPEGTKVSKIVAARGTTAPTPIVFGPNGAADATEIILIDRQQKTISLRLGALPGLVDIGDVNVAPQS